jgi:disulfide oxidoreductase YuzD
MKILLRLVSLVLIAALCLSFVSCGNEEDVYERVRNYLEKEYPEREFTVLDYEKRNETSGRYEINARCLDDGTEFKIYMYSSIAVTDGYSVERANAMMNEIISSEIGEEMLKKFKYIKWYNIYADRATDYRFREVPVAEKFSLASLNEIYEIKVSENVSKSEMGSVIYDFIYSLCDEPEDECSVTKAVFTFKIGRYTYRFTTSSKAVLSLGRDGLTYYVLTNIENDSAPFKDVEFEYFTAEEIEEAENKAENAKKR